MSPVLVAVDDDGYLVVSTRRPAYKVRNVRRNPAVSVCVLPDGFFGRWVQIDGRATVVDLPEAMEPLVDYYRRVSGEHPDWAEYRAAMERDRRVIIRIEPIRAGPDRSG
jgi:PPOX class probable F420-dependent enzyme